MADQPPKPVATPDVPQDDDDLRGFYFRQLMRSPTAQAITAVSVVAVGVGLAIAVSPAIGAIAALVVLLIAVVTCFAMASARAASAFYSAYAASRNLSYNGSRGSLPRSASSSARGTTATRSGP